MTYAGAVLLRRLSDRVGLTDALAGVLPSGTASSWRDRATALVGIVVAIALAAMNLLEVERFQLHHGPSSDRQCRTSRCTGCCPRRTRRGAHRSRRYGSGCRNVWTLLHLRPGGFPYLTVAGRHLKGWIVLDMDATVITAASRSRGAVASCSRYLKRGKPAHRSDLFSAPDGDIVWIYGAECWGIVQYYLLASDVFRLSRLRWVMETSLLKTLVGRHRTRVAVIARK